MDISNLHEIQRSILEKLGYEEEKSFSELQGNLPSNKLAFHLNQLTEKGVIEKIGDKYTTTKKGRELIIEFLGAETTNPVTLLSLVIFKQDKVYLEEQKSALSIFKNMYRPPTDKVRKRERLRQTASRIYQERLGKKIEEVEHVGMFDKKVTLKDGTLQKYLLIYLKTDYNGGKNQNFYKISELDEKPIITDVDKVIKKIYENPNLSLMGEWEVKQREEGFESTKLEF